MFLNDKQGIFIIINIFWKLYVEMWTFGNLLLKDIIQTQPTLSVQSVGVFMADFDCFDFVVRSFAALDLTGVFRRFFGVDVAFATFDGDLSRE